MFRNNLFSLTIWQKYEPELQKQVEEAHEQQNALLKEHPELQREEHEDARREGLNAQRSALTGMLSSGLISDAVYEELVTEVDHALELIASGPEPTGDELTAVRG